MSYELKTFISSLWVSVKSHVTTKLIIAPIVALITFFLGAGFVNSMGALIALCVVDFVLSISVAHYKHIQVTSSKMPKKAFDLFVYFTIASVMNLLSLSSVSGIFGQYLVEGIIVWFAIGEAISILEHFSELGYKIPISVFQNLNKKRAELYEDTSDKL